MHPQDKRCHGIDRKLPFASLVAGRLSRFAVSRTCARLIFRYRSRRCLPKLKGQCFPLIYSAENGVSSSERAKSCSLARNRTERWLTSISRGTIGFLGDSRTVARFAKTPWRYVSSTMCRALFFPISRLWESVSKASTMNRYGDRVEVHRRLIALYFERLDN